MDGTEVGKGGGELERKELERKTHELNERLKELNCLYEISDIMELQRLSPKDALTGIVNILPPAFQFPEFASSRIHVNGDIFKSQNFREGPYVLTYALCTEETKVGKIEVFYSDKVKFEGHDPFLKEERKLMKVIAERLCKFVEKFRSDDELNRYQKQLKEIMAGTKTEFHHAAHKPTPVPKTDWQVIIDMLIKTDPGTLLRVSRKMMYHLSRKTSVSFDSLVGSLCPINGPKADEEWCGINMPNPRSDIKELEKFQEGVFEIAQQNLSSQEIMELLVLWLRQNNAKTLLQTAEKMGSTLKEVKDALNHFWKIPEAERILSPENDVSIRTNLIRRFFTEKLEYINVAKRFIMVEDFVEILDKTIGPTQGVGKLGGKASGIILAQKVLRKEIEADPDLSGISFANTKYVSSDTMREFIHYNALDEVSEIKYMEPNEIRQEQPFLEQVFKNAAFPVETIAELRDVLREFNSKPIIVRSSSHLEDSFGAAFSGKYKSLFLPNIGTEQERLNALMDAIAEVWASTFGPNAIEYRRERGMLDLMEDMGVLIQEVVGTRVGPYYFPAFAGVGFSNNEFRWSHRIRREDGILRLVVGLGTRAVDRVSDDYPMLLSPHRPELRVNTLVDEAVLYSQRRMDVINLETLRIETVDVADVFAMHGKDYPLLTKIASVHKDGQLIPPSGMMLDAENDELVVTFNGVIERTQFVKQIRKVLEVLKERLGVPVDVEFAHDGKSLHILQCRPQSQASGVERIPVPKDIPMPRQIFSARRYVTTGSLNNIDWIVYVNPMGYESLEKREDMIAVAHAVGDLNQRLPKRRFILMGPGRWGSRGDIKLGVPVQYRDLNNTALLIEVARRKGGYVPELSFGTHFFQDLVEAGIQYLPLYPDELGIVFNEQLLEISENHLSEFCTGCEKIADVVKLVRVADISEGGTLSIIMDGDAGEALAFTVPPNHSAWRMGKAKEIADALDPQLYGVVALYVVGSSKEYTAGLGSDIDLIVHHRGTEDQKEDLLAWLKGWSVKLAAENYVRTGYKCDGLLDVHVVTDKDIQEKGSWATHIDSVYGKAKELQLPRHRKDEYE
ncbi:MAG: PEP/pyruvate-binding domain-containing protein [Methanobacteriota archaeon]